MPSRNILVSVLVLAAAFASEQGFLDARQPDALSQSTDMQDVHSPARQLGDWSAELTTAFLEAHASASAARASAEGSLLLSPDAHMGLERYPQAGYRHAKSADSQQSGHEPRFQALAALEDPPAPDGGETNQAPAMDSCEVCTYVLENKEMLQPYLCRGLKDPSQQLTVRFLPRCQLCLTLPLQFPVSCRKPTTFCVQCVKVMLSLMWWLPSEAYWINYGCQRNNGGTWAWVRPCSPHVICSWLKALDAGNEQPFCPEDPTYRKPQ